MVKGNNRNCPFCGKTLKNLSYLFSKEIIPDDNDYRLTCRSCGNKKLHLNRLKCENNE